MESEEIGERVSFFGRDVRLCRLYTRVDGLEHHFVVFGGRSK